MLASWGGGTNILTQQVNLKNPNISQGEDDGVIGLVSQEAPVLNLYADHNTEERKRLGYLYGNEANDLGIKLVSTTDAQGRKAELRLARTFGFGLLLEGIEGWTDPIGFKCTITRTAPNGFAMHFYKGTDSGLYNAVKLAKTFSYYLRFFMAGQHEVDIINTAISEDNFECYYWINGQQYVMIVEPDNSYTIIKIFPIPITEYQEVTVTGSSPVFGALASNSPLLTCINFLFEKKLPLSFYVDSAVYNASIYIQDTHYQISWWISEKKEKRLLTIDKTTLNWDYSIME